MKRSDMIDKMRIKVREIENELDDNLDLDWDSPESVETWETNACSLLLDFLVSEGMLPPPNTCVLVPDHLRGDTKHSSVERKWDEE